MRRAVPISLRSGIGKGKRKPLRVGAHRIALGPYRFYFYAADRGEPPHVHVEHDSKDAKIWLDPVRLARSGGFRRREIVRIISLVWEHHQKLLGAWNEFFTH